MITKRIEIKDKLLDMYDQWLEDVLDTYYKPEVHQIKLSSSFMARARCKKCGEKPQQYFAMMLPPLFKGPQDLRGAELWVRDVISSWGVEIVPRYFDKSTLNFQIDERSFNPKLYNTRGINPSHKFYRVELLACPCGQTLWAFNQKSVISRPEIVKRKSKYYFPNIFDR